MYQHVIKFTSAESALLREQYQLLFRHLEEGKGPREKYLATLKTSMQKFLYSQAGLKTFWDQVDKEPRQHFHLHLVYKEKELLNLPWQLAVPQHIHISKSTSPISPDKKLQPEPGPMRVLIMIASPEDLGIHHRLSYEKEEEIILQALGPLWETGQVQIDFTEDGSLAALQRHLEKNHYHVLYITGHGAYQKNTGYLLLEDEITLASRQVSAKQLGQVLLQTQQHIPHLVVLASCQTGQGNSGHGFRGVADELIGIGVPAVIAMAASVLDYYATLFAGGLFAALAGHDELPAAYTHAITRMELQEQQRLKELGSPHVPAQWLIPQLYCSAQVGHITNWQKAEASSSTQQAVSLRMENDFIGRRRETAQAFVPILKKEPLLIRGAGGTGKSALARHLVRRLLIHTPGYQPFVFNEATAGFGPMLEQLYKYLREQHGHDSHKEEDTEEKKLDALLKELTLRCKPVWVFDDIDALQTGPGAMIDEDHQDWFDYIRQRLFHKYPVILISRFIIEECPDIPDISIHQAPFLDLYRKCRQLHVCTIQQVNPRLSLDTTAHLLYTMLGGHYRAIELFDKMYKQAPAQIAGILEKIKDGDTTLSKKVTASVRQLLLKDSEKIFFTEQFDFLGEEEVYVLQLLAQFRKPVHYLALLAQDQECDAQNMLPWLYDMTLVEEGPQDYYSLTPLIRDFLQGKDFAPVQFSHDMAARYYLYVDGEMEKNEDDISNWQEAFWHYSCLRDIEKLNMTGLHICDYLYTHSQNNAALRYAAQVEAIAGDKTDTRLLNLLGTLHIIQGKYDIALNYLKKVHAISKKEKNKALEAAVLNNISAVYMERGDLNTAQTYQEMVQPIQPDNEDSGAAECTRLNNQAHLMIKAGRLKEALPLLKKGLALAKKIKFTLGQAGVLNSIGQLYLLMADRARAEQAYKEGLALVEDTNHFNARAALLFDLGMLYRDNRKDELALKYLLPALTLLQQLGERSNEAIALNAIGSIYFKIGNMPAAWDTLNRSLLIHREIGNTIGEAGTLQNLSQAASIAKDEVRALKYAEESLALSRTTGNLDGIISALNTLATLYLEKKSSKKALEYCNEALDISEQQGNQHMAAYIVANMAVAYDQQHDDANALTYYIEAADRKRAVGDHAGAGIACQHIAILYFKKKQYQLYSEFIRHALIAFEKADYKEGIYEIGKRRGIMLAFGIITAEESNVDIGFTDEQGHPVSDAFKSKMIREGLKLLQRCLHIGQDAGYSDVDEIKKLIEAAESKLSALPKNKPYEPTPGTDPKNKRADRKRRP